MIDAGFRSVWSLLMRRLLVAGFVALTAQAAQAADPRNGKAAMAPSKVRRSIMSLSPGSNDFFILPPFAGEMVKGAGRVARRSTNDPNRWTSVSGGAEFEACCGNRPREALRC